MNIVGAAVAIVIAVAVGWVLGRSQKIFLPGPKFMAYVDASREQAKREERKRILKIIKDARFAGTTPWMIVRDDLLECLGLEENGNEQVEEG